MKKTLLILLIVFTFLMNSASFSAQAIDTKRVLSEMTEEECLAFIAENGLQIPNELKAYEGLGQFVKDIITIVEEDPDCQLAYSYYVTLAFANDIKEIVNNYYGVLNSSRVAPASIIIDELEDSEIVGVWDPVFEEYNCYAFALGYTSSPTNSIFAPYPGYFSDPGDFSASDSVGVWADLVVADLKAEGHSCVFKTTDHDDAMELENTHTIICLRKSQHPDFHFMRWEINSWYHKPSLTHVLRYLYTYPYADVWTNERSIDGVNYAHTATYTGTIYYFAFKNNHSVTSTYNNFHYHLGSYHYFEYLQTCRYCGESTYILKKVECSGPPCSVAYPNAVSGEFVNE